MNYADKIKDPRWQKKRLEILKRDDFRCQFCGDDESPLHVHHKYYLPDTDPWDYNDNALITLCESCHEVEHEFKEKREKDFLITLYDLGLYPIELRYMINEYDMDNKKLSKEEIIDNIIKTLNSLKTR